MYEFEIDALEKMTSGAGNLMYKGTFRVVAPDTYAGVALFEYFTIGNAEDPKGENPETVKNAPGIRNLKRLFKAVQIPLASEIDDMVAQAQGQHFIGAVEQKTETKEGKYKDTKRNEIRGYYPLGSRAIGGASAPARQTAVATSAPGGQTAKSPAVRAGKPAAAATLNCPFCQEPMARADYSAHVKAKHPDEA